MLHDKRQRLWAVPVAVEIYLILIVVTSPVTILHETLTTNEQYDDFVYMRFQLGYFFVLPYSFRLKVFRTRDGRE